MIDPGQMRHRITFQKFSGELDAYGDPIQTDAAQWEDVATVWAAIDPISGREFYEAQQSQSEVSHKIRCRYRPGLTTDMRIKYRDRVFEIVSIINWQERGESLLIMAKELVQ